jgi:hypothetical protein
LLTEGGASFSFSALPFRLSLFSVRELQKFPLLDDFFDDGNDDAGGADDAGCWFQKGRGIVVLGEEDEDEGGLDEKQIGACRLEPGMRFPEPGTKLEAGGEQRLCGLADN